MAPKDSQSSQGWLVCKEASAILLYWLQGMLYALREPLNGNQIFPWPIRLALESLRIAGMKLRGCNANENQGQGVVSDDPDAVEWPPGGS